MSSFPKQNKTNKQQTKKPENTKQNLVCAKMSLDSEYSVLMWVH